MVSAGDALFIAYIIDVSTWPWLLGILVGLIFAVWGFIQATNLERLAVVFLVFSLISFLSFWELYITLALWFGTMCAFVLVWRSNKEAKAKQRNDTRDGKPQKLTMRRYLLVVGIIALLLVPLCLFGAYSLAWQATAGAHDNDYIEEKQVSSRFWMRHAGALFIIGCGSLVYCVCTRPKREK